VLIDSRQVSLYSILLTVTSINDTSTRRNFIFFVVLKKKQYCRVLGSKPDKTHELENTYVFFELDLSVKPGVHVIIES